MQVWEAAVMAQVIGSLPHTWGSWIKFPVSSIGPWPRPLQALGSEPAAGSSLSPSAYASQISLKSASKV